MARNISMSLNESCDDDVEISEKVIGKQREIVYRGPPDFDFSKLQSYMKRENFVSLPDGEVLVMQSVKPVGKNMIQHTLIFRSDLTDDTTTATTTSSDDSMKKQPTPSNSTTSNVSTKKPFKGFNQICSDRLAELGVVMPPGMVLHKSSRWIIPILRGPLMRERKSIVAEHEYINRNVFIVLLLIPVWLLVTIGLSKWKPYYASLGIGFWLSIIHYLGSIIYLCYLRKKDQELEKFLAELTEIVFKYRMKLRMVKVDDVKADQPGTDLINMNCYLATFSLFSNLDAWINLAVVVGLFGLVFCGEFYLSAHSKLIFAVAVAVINATICFGVITKKKKCFGRVAVSFIKRTISFGRRYFRGGVTPPVVLQ